MDLLEIIVILLVAAVLGFFLGGFLLWLYWNFAVVAVFSSAPTITFWQAAVAALGASLFLRGSSSSSK